MSEEIKEQEEIEEQEETEGEEEVDVCSAELELEGTVYYVEKDKDDNVISKSPIPGDAVLGAVMAALEAGLQAEEYNDDDDDEAEDAVIID